MLLHQKKIEKRKVEKFTINPTTPEDEISLDPLSGSPIPHPQLCIPGDTWVKLPRTTTEIGQRKEIEGIDRILNTNNGSNLKHLFI